LHAGMLWAKEGENMLWGGLRVRGGNRVTSSGKQGKAENLILKRVRKKGSVGVGGKIEIERRRGRFEARFILRAVFLLMPPKKRKRERKSQQPTRAPTAQTPKH